MDVLLDQPSSGLSVILLHMARWVRVLRERYRVRRDFARQFGGGELDWLFWVLPHRLTGIDSKRIVQDRLAEQDRLRAR